MTTDLPSLSDVINRAIDKRIAEQTGGTFSASTSPVVNDEPATRERGILGQIRKVISERQDKIGQLQGVANVPGKEGRAEELRKAIEELTKQIKSLTEEYRKAQAQQRPLTPASSTPKGAVVLPASGSTPGTPGATPTTPAKTAQTPAPVSPAAPQNPLAKVGNALGAQTRFLTQFGSALRMLNTGLADVSKSLRGMVGTATTGFAMASASLGGFARAASPRLFDTLTGSVQLLAGSIGQALVKPILQVSYAFQQAARWVRGLDEGLKDSLARWAVFGTLGLGTVAILGKLGGMITPVVSLFGTLAGGILKVAGGLVSLASAAGGLASLGGIGAALGALAPLLAPVLPIIAAIGAGLAAIGGSMALAAAISPRVLTPLLDAGKVVLDVLGRLWDTLKEAVSGIFPRLEAAARSFAPLFEAAGMAISSIASAIGAMIGPMIGPLVSAFTAGFEVISKVAGYLGAVLQPVLKVVGGLLQGLGSVFGQVFGGLVEVVGAGLRVLGSLLDPIMRIASAVGDMLAPVFEFLGNVLSGTGKVIGFLVGGALKSLATILEGIARVVDTIVSGLERMGILKKVGDDAGKSASQMSKFKDAAVAASQGKASVKEAQSVMTEDERKEFAGLKTDFQRQKFLAEKAKESSKVMDTSAATPETKERARTRKDVFAQASLDLGMQQRKELLLAARPEVPIQQMNVADSRAFFQNQSLSKGGLEQQQLEQTRETNRKMDQVKAKMDEMVQLQNRSNNMKPLLGP